MSVVFLSIQAYVMFVSQFSCLPIIFYNFLNYRLAKEEELTEARSKAELLEKENVEIVTKLSLKEQELDRKTQEKVIFRPNNMYIVVIFP